MNYLIYELFSGVGLCNQLFSLETAIYLANIMDRKLILFIKNPLCHCGKATWDYGYLLNFFTNDYYKYLPHGLDVYYRNLTPELNTIISNKDIHYKCDRFSNIVFVDSSLNTKENDNDIKDFCHYRGRHIFDLNEFTNKEYVYINTSNASRCFYNFYTTKDNYKLMYDICTSIKFKPIFYELASNIYSELSRKRNNLFIFFHLRFGDQHKDQHFIERSNSLIIKKVTEFMEGHKTNLINPDVYLLVDNKKNIKFTEAVKKYNFKYIENFTANVYKNFINTNTMTFHDVQSVNRYEVVDAILEMILASKSDEFAGYVSSTFSHYIQFLRFCNNKSYYNYINLDFKHEKYCRLLQIKDSNIEWQRLGFRGGHPVGWHYFFKPYNINSQINFAIDGKSDGFGSQLQACFSLIAYCHYKGINYIHKPFDRMHHNDDNLPNFPQIMNEFVNLEHEFRSIKSLSNFELSQLHRAKEGYFVHGSLHPEFFYTEEVLNKIRRCYYSKEKPDISSIFNKDKYNVAVHIRRGDVNNYTPKHASRYTANSQYINMLSKHKFPNNVQLHLFSEGKSEDFDDIIKAYPNIKLHLSTNIRETFHCMVSADLLIMSRSSFCYSAALINENKIDCTLIRTWWHKPLKSWM